MREQFLAAAAAYSSRPAEVAGMRVLIRPVPLRVMTRVRQRLHEGDEAGVARETIKGCLLDPEGNAMFTDDDDDIINEWPAEFVQTLLDAITPMEDEPGN